MTKFVRSIALAAAIAALVCASGMSVAPAQDKKTKDTVKTDDTKKTTTKKDDVTGTVELNKDARGMYRFKIVGEDGKALAMTTKGYEKKEDALKAIEMVKSILSKAKVTEVKDADNDEKDAKKDTKKKEPEKK